MLQVFILCGKKSVLNLGRKLAQRGSSRFLGNMGCIHILWKQYPPTLQDMGIAAVGKVHS
jgi:hypothetical protein